MMIMMGMKTINGENDDDGVLAMVMPMGVQ